MKHARYFLVVYWNRSFHIIPHLSQSFIRRYLDPRFLLANHAIFYFSNLNNRQNLFNSSDSYVDTLDYKIEIVRNNASPSG